MGEGKKHYFRFCIFVALKLSKPFTLIIIVMKQASLFLAALLIAVASAAPAFAQSGTCGNNLTWSLSDGTLTIDGSGAMTNYSWTSSSRAPWYNYRSQITTVVLPADITTIGNYAFYECSSLTELDLSEYTNLTSIGEMAFYHCTGLTSIDLSGCTALTSIGNYAFAGCSSLTSVDLSTCSSLTSIEYCAFRNNSSIMSIDLPESLTSLGTMRSGIAPG